MSKNYIPKLHHRRSIRLKGYDYSQEGLYFITLCCQHRRHYFGKIRDGKIIFSPVGEIVKEEWQKTPSLRPNTRLHQYIIMPNHFHAIIEILFSAQYQFREEKENSKDDKNSQSGESKLGSKKSNSKEDIRTGELQFANEFRPKRTQFKRKRGFPYGRIAIRPNRIQIAISNDRRYHSRI